MKTRMPWDSTTVSPAACSSSQPSSYDIPEQPPPTRRIRSPQSGLPSSCRNSVTFLAAVSVRVTITRPPAGLDLFQILSQDTARRQEGDLLERGPWRECGHQHDDPGDVLGAQHPATVGSVRNRVPEGSVGGPGQDDADADAVTADLLGQDPAEGHDPRLRCAVDGRA